MTKSKLVGIRMDEPTIAVLDRLVEEGGYKSRSAYIKHIILHNIIDSKTQPVSRNELLYLIQTDEEIQSAIKDLLKN